MKSNLNQYYIYTVKDNAVGAYDTLIFDVDLGDGNNNVFYNSASGNYYVPNAIITDTSAWYHMVYVWDMNNGTEADRIRIWLNGNRLAKLTGTTYELINILIFIIGYPVFVFILFGIIYWQYKKIKHKIKF